MRNKYLYMNFPNKIVIGSDHAGFEYKAQIIEFLKEKNIDVIDVGTYSDASCDYPDYAHALAEKIENKEANLGILLCGSANGVAMAANKHQGIRAALCWENEIASLARTHNDANVICLPARYITIEAAFEMVSTFLTTDFEGGRHQKRVDKI